MTSSTSEIVTLPVSSFLAAATPTADKYRLRLDPVPNWNSEPKGDTEDDFDWSIRINRDHLLSIEVCHAIIKEIDAASVVASELVANRLARLLLGGYIISKVHDRKTFARLVTNAFEHFPADIGRASVEILTRNLKWPPNRADVFEECSKLMRWRTHRKRVAEAHLGKHKEIAAEAEAERKRVAAWVAGYEKHPYRRIYSRWCQSFKMHLNLVCWLERLPQWVEYHGEGEVEKWHQEVSTLFVDPRVDALGELTRRAQKAELGGMGVTA
jgi:hypothetical protein